MSSTTTRGEIWRERIADWWADAWRWVLGGIRRSRRHLLHPRARGRRRRRRSRSSSVAFVIAAALTPPRSRSRSRCSPCRACWSRSASALGGGDLSVSDAALAAAFGTALLLGHRPYSRAAAPLLLLNLVYQFATLFTVIVNPYVLNTSSGSTPGCWSRARSSSAGRSARAGYGRLALSLIVVTALRVRGRPRSSQGVLQYAAGTSARRRRPGRGRCTRTSSEPCSRSARSSRTSTPTGWAGPRGGRGSRSGSWSAAIVVAQSRQALIGSSRRSSSPCFAGAPPDAPAGCSCCSSRRPGSSSAMVIEQIESQNRHNSVFQRVEWFREVYHFWRESPIFGHGLRYWYNPGELPFQPPQAELEVARLRRRRRPHRVPRDVDRRARRALARRPALRHARGRRTARRLVQAQFDLFWVAVQVSVPFVVAGICLGAMDHERRSKEAPDEMLARAPLGRLTPTGTVMAASEAASIASPTRSRGSIERGQRRTARWHTMEPIHGRVGRAAVTPRTTPEVAWSSATTCADCAGTGSPSC